VGRLPECKWRNGAAAAGPRGVDISAGSAEVGEASHRERVLAGARRNLGPGMGLKFPRPVAVMKLNRHEGATGTGE
jgi:hypothetical protein